MSDSNEHLKLVRFRQRRSNFTDAFNFLEEASTSNAAIRIKNAAIIKAFEMCFELGWKSLKDYLEYQGIVVSTPRDVLKESFKAGYVEDGQGWLELLEHRNTLVHVYNQQQSSHAVGEIHSSAFPKLQKLALVLERLTSENR